MNELNFFVQNGWIQDGRIQDGCHHPINQIELVWVRVLCTMAESNMAHFKMAAIIRFIRLNYFQSEAEWSESVFEWIWEKITRCLNPRWQNSRCCHHQVEWEWMSEVFLCIMAESKMTKSKMAAIIKLSENEWMKFSFVQNGWIQDGRIQDGWHHQIEWEWMSLSHIELVWVRVLCKIVESKMAEFKMDAIIKLGKNEWVWVRLN